MAKSTRSKVKRAWRSKKREDSVYAAVEAARLHRLNEKLAAVAAPNAPEPKEQQDGSAPEAQESAAAVQDHSEPMAIDTELQSQLPKNISTHGPRNSRRDEWRASKGLVPRPKVGALNRQGTLAARRRAGRSKRRR